MRQSLKRGFGKREPPEHADDESRIRSVVLALQSYREHAARELETKLTRKGYDALTSAQVIEDLRESGLVSDARFTEVFVRSHASRGHGPIRIRYELRELGVLPDLIESSIHSAEFDWAMLAGEVRQRKFGEKAPPDYAARAKQMRFLQYRGFSTDQIRAAFAALGSSAHEADDLPDLDPDE
jgi:regulatory protein